MKSRPFLNYTFLILSCSLLQACFLFRPLPGKLYKRAVAAKPYDVIIVPGTPYNGKKWRGAYFGPAI
jgi:hypothetical protein